MALFKNKYRNESIRAQWWDYGWAAAYFVTICTKGRIPYFGEIQNGKMDLTPTGAIADVLWYEIKNHAHDVELDAFVVMPNHVHGILVLKNDSSDVGTGKSGVGTGNPNVGTGQPNVGTENPNVGTGQPNVGTENPNVGTGHALSQQNQPGKNRFQNPGKNTLSSIIGSYKSAVTRHVRRLGYSFDWQPRFYDHIIRDDASYLRIAQYIENNPKNWKEDSFNSTSG